MESYKVYTTEEFDRDFSRLDKSVREQVAKEVSKLEENPYVGKPLGYRFFREKKVGGHRIYYLIYEEHIVVFVIALSDKKGQQAVIDAVKGQLDFYKEEIRKRFGL